LADGASIIFRCIILTARVNFHARMIILAAWRSRRSPAIGAHFLRSRAIGPLTIIIWLRFKRSGKLC
jgi:hypothetical protein